MTTKHKILIVDDEEFNLDIMKEYLIGAGYEVISAENGNLGLARLEEHHDTEVIILDRMMSPIDGMGMLKKVKSDVRFCDIPVIMQTASALNEQVIEGIKAGVYYYLTKPYGEEIFLSIVKAALADAKNKKQLKEDVTKHKLVLGMMERASFHFRTLEEAKNLAYFIANCFPDPETTIYGLNELLINAIEHGNLGITYSDKTKLLMEGTWRNEVERRLNLPENLTKLAYLSFEHLGNTLKVTIKDQGNGFDWKNYLEISAERITDPHGRGIAMSKMMSFTSVDFVGNGNEVICKVEVSDKQ